MQLLPILYAYIVMRFFCEKNALSNPVKKYFKKKTRITGSRESIVERYLSILEVNLPLRVYVMPEYLYLCIPVF